MDSGSPTSASPHSGGLNYSEDLIGQEARHVISAWGAPVRPREDNLNATYDFGNMVVLGSLTFPRQGRLLGWRAYFSRTDLPVGKVLSFSKKRDWFLVQPTYLKRVVSFSVYDFFFTPRDASCE